jgi:hypothetical protein
VLERGLNISAMLAPLAFRTCPGKKSWSYFSSP